MWAAYADGSVIIDCHGHYTTAPAQLGAYRDGQLAALRGDPGHVGAKGTLSISDNADLLTVDGLENLSTIGASLIVYDNDLLSDLAGLSGLTSLGQSNPDPEQLPPLYVFFNPALASCWPDVLEAQTAQQCGYSVGPGQFYDCSGNEGAGSCE